MDNKYEEIAKQIEENSKKLLDKCDECLELIREAKECVCDGNIK